MKWKIRRGDGERYYRFIAAFCAALMVLTAGLLTVFSSMVRAVDYTVSGEGSDFTAGNGSKCHLVSVSSDVQFGGSGEDISWEIQDVTLGSGDSYRDAENNYYFPEGGSGTVTVGARGNVLVAPSAMGYSLLTYKFVDGRTLLTYRVENAQGPVAFYLESYQGEDETTPDVNGVVQSQSGVYLYQTAEHYYAPLPKVLFSSSADFIPTNSPEDTIYGTGADNTPQYLAPGMLEVPGYVIDKIEFNFNNEELMVESRSVGAAATEISENDLFGRSIAEITVYLSAGYNVRFSESPGSDNVVDVILSETEAMNYILPACTFSPPAGQQFKAWQILNPPTDIPMEYPAGSPIDITEFIAPENGMEFIPIWEDAPEVPVDPPLPPDEPDEEDPPAGGGGDTEKIRVDNQLNLPGNSSDTILWPLDTTEKGGISTTTIRDKELDALIDLARKHEEDAENLDGDGFKEGIILIEDLKATSKNHTYILNITEEQFDILVAEDWDRLTVATPAGNFGLYGSALEELENRTDKGDVSFQLDRLTHEGRPGLDATLLVDGKAVTSFEEPYGIQLMVPYTPASGEDVNAVAVDYLPENGEPVPVTECYYDENKEGVVLHSSHLSKFGVVYRPATFTDVTASHWANPYVTFLTARGILTASDGSAFRPDDAVTRGETLELFARALSAAKLPANPVQVYSDIPTSSSVAKAASWAYYNNLSGSIANGSSYRPNESITREDMAALLGDISTGVGLRLRSKGLDTGYNDMNEIAGYAQNSVKRLRAVGILEMPSSYRFYPDSTLTRGELAQILALLLSNI